MAPKRRTVGRFGCKLVVHVQSLQPSLVSLDVACRQWHPAMVFSSGELAGEDGGERRQTSGPDRRGIKLNI